MIKALDRARNSPSAKLPAIGEELTLSFVDDHFSASPSPVFSISSRRSHWQSLSGLGFTV